MRSKSKLHLNHHSKVALTKLNYKEIKMKKRNLYYRMRKEKRVMRTTRPIHLQMRHHQLEVNESISKSIKMKK